MKTVFETQNYTFVYIWYVLIIAIIDLFSVSKYLKVCKVTLTDKRKNVYGINGTYLGVLLEIIFFWVALVALIAHIILEKGTPHLVERNYFLNVAVSYFSRFYYFLLLPFLTSHTRKQSLTYIKLVNCHWRKLINKKNPNCN